MVLSRWLLPVVAVTLSLAVVGGAVRSFHNTALADARAETTSARAATAVAVHAAERATIAAASERLRADRALAASRAAGQRADSLARTFRAAAAVAPDTCAPFLAAADSALASMTVARDSAVSAAGVFRSALDSSLVALARLTSAAAQLDTASGKLVEASRPSLLARLMPNVGIGAAAGINPLGRFDTVLGITLGWTF